MDKYHLKCKLFFLKDFLENYGIVHVCCYEHMI